MNEAIGIRDRLARVEKEIGYRLDGNKELNKLDAHTCADAREMLEKLDTEVFRLRAAIGHYRYGRMSRAELFKIAQTWNGDE